MSSFNVVAYNILDFTCLPHFFSDPVVDNLTFPLSVGSTISVVCSLLYGGTYAAARSQYDFVGDQDPLLVLNFGARSIPVTSINHGVVRQNITKNKVSNRSFNIPNRLFNMLCIGYTPFCM